MGAGDRKEPQVKGTAFRTIDLCFRELRGASHYARAHELMAPEVAAAYKSGILASSWYSIRWYCEAFRAYRAATGEMLELPRAIGRAAVRHDMQGVHKQWLLKIVSPQVLLNLSQLVFNSYYDSGTLKVLESRKGYAQIQCERCFGWDENMWSELVGSCETQLELAGAQHIRMRTLDGGKNGDARIKLEAHWIVD